MSMFCEGIEYGAIRVLELELPSRCQSSVASVARLCGPLNSRTKSEFG